MRVPPPAFISSLPTPPGLPVRHYEFTHYHFRSNIPPLITSSPHQHDSSSGGKNCRAPLVKAQAAYATAPWLHNCCINTARASPLLLCERERERFARHYVMSAMSIIIHAAYAHGVCLLRARAVCLLLCMHYLCQVTQNGKVRRTR